MKHILFLTTLFFCSTLWGQQKDSLLFEKEGFSIFKNKAVFQDSILYDVNTDYKRILKVEEDGNGECIKGIEIKYIPLSFLGDFYSFENLRYDSGGGRDCYRNPSNNISIQTINVKTRNSVNLLDLVEEEALVAALKSDTWVRDMYGVMDTTQLDSLNTFKEILQLMNQNMGFGEAFSANNFALHSYDAKKSILAIRLIGIEYMGYNHSKKIQLGLLVKPKPKIKSVLDREEGFFMGNFKNRQKKYIPMN